MPIKVARWKDDAISPLIFMIDDLANIYIKERYGDWGGRRSSVDSVYQFLEKELLNYYPYLRFTFFVVTDKRTPQVVGQYDYVEDCNSGCFDSFLKQLDKSGHEIAYHGTNHGEVVDGEFVQEWDFFQTAEDATSQTREGLNLLSSAINRRVLGGKYCGYKPGKFGHSSIRDNKIKWWFDTWDSLADVRPHGEFIDGIYYLPSNVDCSQYLMSTIGRVPLSKYFKSQVKNILGGNIIDKIDYLLSGQGIISLQEHTSPIRTDKKIQYPNVVYDLHNIRAILGYLKRFNVWYTTPSEVYFYELAKKNLEIKKTNNGFYLILNNVELADVSGYLTLVLSNSSIVKNATDYYFVNDDELLLSIAYKDLLSGVLLIKV